MARKPVSRRVQLVLIAVALLLPMAVCVLLALGTVLGAMGDSNGKVVLGVIAWSCGGLWILDLICLLLAQAVNSLAEPPETPEEPSQRP